MSKSCMSVAAVVSIIMMTSLCGAEEGKKGNDWPKRSEPAVQCVKTTARGVQALVYHSVRSLKEGNEKFPILGSIEIFRGIRRGAIELVDSTYRGMAASKPRPVDKVCRLNKVIDEDILLRNAADLAATGAVLAPTGSAPAAPVGVWAGQKVFDRSPTAPEKEGAAEGSVKKAQKRYVGKRAESNKKPKGTGNLLKEFK